MNFLMVLGREPKISLAELEAVFSASKVKQIAPNLAIVTAHSVQLDRLGGSLKAAQIIDEPIQDYLSALPEGKITLGISDYSTHANPRKTWELALKYKNMLKRHGRNVRLVPNGKNAVLPSATSHHNQLGEKTNHIEIVKYSKYTAISIGTQNITSYSKRDFNRPARDAFVGMLPPKLAQILINLATNGAKTGTVLDPFCGTGVILQESVLMGLSAYGTDLSEKTNSDILICTFRFLPVSRTAENQIPASDLFREIHSTFCIFDQDLTFILRSKQAFCPPVPDGLQ